MPVLCAISTLLLLAAAAPGPTIEARRRQLADLLAEQWEYNLRTNPEFASQLGDKRYNDKLTDASEAAVLADLGQSRRFLARFQAIESAGFTAQEKLDRALMVRALSLALEGARFKEWEMPVTQFGGLHVDLPQWVSVFSFETVKDYEDYIARLEAIPLAFAQTTALMRKGMADKLVPPQILLEQVARQADAIAKAPPAQSPFFVEPAGKLPASFPQADRDRLRAGMLGAIRDRVQPAYVDFARFVSTEYAPAGRREPGLWALPDGPARYAFAVKTSTTTDLTPDQIHQLGLDEVARDRAAMLAIARKLGFQDLKSFDVAARANPKLHPRSRQEMLDLYRQHTDQMWGLLPRAFGRLPKARVEIMQTEAYREKEASGAQYKEGTPDGKRPGHIKVNTGDFQDRTTMNIETTAYHEGVPGHHLQMSIAQEIPTLAPFRQHALYTAFVEGWALYAERLAEELGAYRDPYSAYGHLQDDLLRAIRLVADTGFHSRHWTRQQVVDYFHDHSGIDEVEVQSETDRYLAWPAQALGYKIGQLKILALREKARRALGKRFDLRGFHDQLLAGGALPLDVVEARLEEWTAEQRGAR